MKAIISKLTYKTLFLYSLVVIALLLVAVPAVTANNGGVPVLDFARRDRSGESPQASRALTKGLNVDHLAPGGEKWYLFRRDSFGSDAWVSLALRYESEAVLPAEQVNFEVFGAEAGGWFQSPEPAAEALGAGLRSPLQTAGQSVTESFWTGQLEKPAYYIRVFNNSPFSLDFTLEAKAEEPAVSGAVPAGYRSALGDAEALSARQLGWTLTAQAVEKMSAAEAARWMQEAQAAGWLVTQGMDPAARPNPAAADPQRLWTLTAQAIEGLDSQTAAQWLIQADSLGWLAIPLGRGSSLPIVDEVDPGEAGSGEVAVPAPPFTEEIYTPINIYPNNPLEFNLHAVNSGRLPPYGEHWYSLRRDDLDEELVEDMKMTLFFTPRTGFMSDRINFEIFPAGQYHIWSRGDSDYMENLGLGMWTSRDEDPDTGERIWNGSLVDGDRYLIKVKNGTADVVDYYLFPDDVERAELGNPTLHSSDAATGYVPYVLSPATRSAME